MKEGSKKIGRPLFDGKNVQDVLTKLQIAFACRANNYEAAAFAGITYLQLTRYLYEHKDFQEERRRLRNLAPLKAKMTIVKGIEKDPYLALRYLQNIKPTEFTPDANKHEDSANKGDININFKVIEVMNNIPEFKETKPKKLRKYRK